MAGVDRSPNLLPTPLRVLVARTVSYRGKADSYGSVSTLFQGVCSLLREAGSLPGVYGVLVSVKQRILNAGQPLTLDDVVDLVGAHNAVTRGTDPLVLGEPQFVFSVRSAGERLAFHREFVHNLQIPQRPLVTFDDESLIEVLATVFHPRHFSGSEKRAMLTMSFAQQEGLGILRILDTLYKATFSRTIRKDLCERKVLFPVPEGVFHLIVDHERTAHLTLPCFELIRYLLFRLYRSPDLAAVLDSDGWAKARIQDGLRLLTGALHDVAVLPQKQQEVQAFLKERRPSDEDLEEL